MSRREHPREGQAEEQQALLPGLAREGVRRARAAQRAAAPVETAATDPVAQVLLDLPLAHLDRLFDFAVPATMADDAQPGVRVKARFAGQETDGFIVARIAESEHTGRLQPLRRVVSPEPVLGPEVVALAGRLAQRYAGTRSDVLRLAVPPRHATTEKEQVDRADGVPLRVLAPERAEAAWADHEHAASWLRGVREGQPARAVWNPPPGTDWPRLVAEAALSTPGGVVVCLPDRRDVDRVDAALTAATGDGPPQHAVLTADLGPAARYRSFLSLSRGRRRIAVGTRAAAFAPVADLRLVVVWDDGDDLHAEPRAPYVHTREVLLSRAELTGAAALVGGFARTVEAHHLLRSGWAHPLTPPREQVRRSVTVSISGASDRELARDPAARAARIPSAVHALMREAVQEGPVLVQNPRSGYVPSLACERCRTPARCPACSGPMRLGGPTDPPSCGWCATPQPAWRCPECGDRGLRAPVLGEARTAEEIGRAMPGVTVRSSARDHVLTRVDARPGVVVATPGAEPVAEGGYAAVVLLDTWLPLSRPDLRTEEEAVRRWAAAIGLVRPGGRAVLVGEPSHPALQALVRWDVAGFAERETVSRSEAHLPPASRMATVTGSPGAVDDALTLLAVPEPAEVLGPVPLADDPEKQRLVVRVPRNHGLVLSDALGELQRLRSARKLDPVRIQVDPPTL